MRRSIRRLLGFSAASGLALSVGAVALGDDAKPASEPFRGALAPVAEDAPRAVRNDAHRAGREVVTLRYFRIKAGAFPEFLAASRDGVWPYFEKIGARVIGMWRVVPPPGGTPPSTDYDEVYLSTRYASAEHWAATRDTVAHGGNGPDWNACKKALDLRESLTLESHVTFLEGELAPGGPTSCRGCRRSTSGWSERERAERGQLSRFADVAEWAAFLHRVRSRWNRLLCLVRVACFETRHALGRWRGFRFRGSQLELGIVRGARTLPARATHRFSQRLGILHPVSGRSVAWTSLTALREKKQRVELWDRSGHSGVDLDFFLDEFENLLARVLSRVSPPAQRATSFRRSIGSIALLVAVFGGAAAWFARTAVADHRPWGLALSLASLAPVAWECWEGLFVVRILGDRVVLRSLFRERVVFLTSVREVRVSRGRQRLDVWLLCESERAQVCPAGCDPFDVYFALRAAIAQRAGK